MLTLLFVLATTDLYEALEQPRTIKPETVLAIEASDHVFDDIHVLDDGRLFLVTHRERKVFAYDGETLTLITRDGQGPGEIDGGFFATAVLDGQLLASTVYGGDLISVYPERKRLADIPFFVRGMIAVGSDDLVAINAIPSRRPIETGAGRMATPDELIHHFTRSDDGFRFEKLFDHADVMPSEVANIYFNRKVRLLPHGGEGLFYKVPGWGAPDFALMDLDGSVLAEWPIPHPMGHRMPTDVEERDSLYHRRTLKGKMLAGVTIATDGTLYFLLDGLTRVEDGVRIDYGGRMIVAMHPERGDLRTILTPKPLRGLWWKKGERALLSFDEDDNLVRLSL